MEVFEVILNHLRFITEKCIIKYLDEIFLFIENINVHMLHYFRKEKYIYE